MTNTPWASNPGAPVSVLGTDMSLDDNTLFTGTRNVPYANASIHRTFAPFSPLRFSGGLSGWTVWRYCGRIPMRQMLPQ